MIGVLGVLLMLGIWGKEVDIAGSSLGGWIVMLSIAAVFLLFGSSAGWFNLPSFFNFLKDSEVMSLLIIILVFGIIISFITGDEKDSKEDRKGIMDNFTRLLGGKGNK
jgi:ascorbate-specific PTS system EIIC-type component UlaA